MPNGRANDICLAAAANNSKHFVRHFSIFHTTMMLIWWFTATSQCDSAAEALQCNQRKATHTHTHTYTYKCSQPTYSGHWPLYSLLRSTIKSSFAISQSLATCCSPLATSHVAPMSGICDSSVNEIFVNFANSQNWKFLNCCHTEEGSRRLAHVWAFFLLVLLLIRLADWLNEWMNWLSGVWT